MIKRIVEISSPSHLCYRNGQLVIRQGESSAKIEHLVPIEDLGVLVVDNQQTTYTQRLIVECALQNVALLICDLKHLPTAFMLPLEGNHLHTKIVREQIQATQPTKNRLWQKLS